MMKRPGRRRRILVRGCLAMLILFLLLPLLTYLGPRGMDKVETADFFNTRHISYLDTVLFIDDKPLRMVACGNDTSPVLLFIHGSPGSWDAFRDCLTDTALLKRYRLIAVDRPGYGGSGQQGEGHLDAQAGRMGAVFAWLRDDRPLTVVGHSYGGAVAVKLATLYPQRIGRLILMAPTISPDIEEQIRWKRNLQKMSRWWVWHWGIRSDMRNSATEMQPLPEQVRQMEAHYDTIRIPVTEVHGTKDMLAPFGNQLYVLKQLKHAAVDTVILEGENHFIPWTAKERMIRLMLDRH